MIPFVQVMGTQYVAQYYNSIGLQLGKAGNQMVPATFPYYLKEFFCDLLSRFRKEGRKIARASERRSLIGMTHCS